mgnify:CR=1 FL=1
MSNIIPFGRKAEGDSEKEGWLNGEAVCLSCAHGWTAVAPRGAPANAPDAEGGLGCPACHSFKGVFRRFVQYTDCPSWHCVHCRGFLFSIILAKGDVPTLACGSCGALTNALDVFNPPT